MAPTSDSANRFFSTMATSILWAASDLIAKIDLEKIPNLTYYNKLFDPLRIDDNTVNDFEILVKQEMPDFLLISSTYDSHNNAKKFSILAKKINPNIIIIYGGPHIKEVCNDNVRLKIPQIYPFNEVSNPFDYLIEGDGELVLTKLVSDLVKYNLDKIYYNDTLKRGTVIKAISGNSRLHVFEKNSSSIYSTNKKSLNLNELPFMPRHLVYQNSLDLYGFNCFYEKGKSGQKILLPSTSTLLHRGCKSGCSFCSERGGYNERNATHIINEIQELKSQGIKGIFFDDSTTGDHNYFEETILPELKKMNLQFAGLNRFDKLLDLKLVEKMRDSGWVYQYCAIEHLDDNVLKLSNKRQGIKQMLQAIYNLERTGMSLGISLLFGLEGETNDSIKRTLDFVAEKVATGLISCVSMSLLSYHPNTPLTLNTKEGTDIQKKMKFDSDPPFNGQPWTSFEEGRWFHPTNLTLEKVIFIKEYANEVMGRTLARNMQKNGNSL